MCNTNRSIKYSWYQLNIYVVTILIFLVVHGRSGKPNLSYILPLNCFVRLPTTFISLKKKNYQNFFSHLKGLTNPPPPNLLTLFFWTHDIQWICSLDVNIIFFMSAFPSTRTGDPAFYKLFMDPDSSLEMFRFWI